MSDKSFVPKTPLSNVQIRQVALATTRGCMSNDSGYFALRFLIEHLLRKIILQKVNCDDNEKYTTYQTQQESSL